MLPKFAPTLNSGPMGSRTSDDPLARAIAPPPDETPEERAQRQQAEDKARKVSEQIDKMLKRDGEKLHSKNKHVVKVLLLGQSESGKSTALKNFQLLYNPHSFHAERAAWRLVVLFNLVRSIRVLHQIVSDALRAQEAESQTMLASSSPMHYRTAAPDFQDLLPPLPTAATIRSKRSTGSFLASPETPTSQAPRPIGATEQETDLTDAASSHSAGTSGTSSSKGMGGTVRRSSIFNLSSRDKKTSPAQSKRPATSQGLSPGIEAMNTGSKGKAESSSRVPSDEVKTRASPLVPGSGSGSSKAAGIFNGDRSRNSSVVDTSSKRANASPPTSPAVDNGEFDNPLFRSRSREGRSRSIVPGSGSVDYTSKMRSNESALYPGDNKQTRSLPTRLGAPALTILLPTDNLPKVTFTNQHRVLLMRLKPLLTVELNLLRRLSFPDEDEAVRLDFNTEGMRAAALHAARAETTNIPGRPNSSSGRPRAGSSADGQPSSSHALASRAQAGSSSASSLDVTQQSSSARIDNGSLPEFTVRSPNWKERLHKWRKYDPSQKMTNNSGEWNPWDDEDDPAHFIQACAADLKALWRDTIVQEYLDRCQIKLEHLPGFFLNDVDRVVTRDYVPTNDDILRARLKTMGVTEHSFSLEGHSRGSTMPKEWLIYDVGGSRTQRAAWQPYFDSANAIIFIVAISAFDETLAEDPSMNRMEDSLRLFRSIVSSPILKNVNLILFLNKMDLLEDKLNAGIQVSRYFKRYGDRPNTVESVTKYFRAKFAAIYDKYTPPASNRVFFSHTTSLTNPQATKAILSAVGESIIGATVQYTLS